MSEIFIILFLILLNGIFSMSEMAVVSARKSNLQAEADKGSKRAKTALKLASDPDRFLSAVQIGITLIGILTGIFSGNKIAAAFSDLLVRAGMSAGLATAIAQGIIVVLVTYLTIVFGELVPKRIALSASERVSKVVAGPMKVISAIVSPFVWLLAKSTGLVIRILGVKSQESKVTEEEIKSIIQEGTDEGEVSPVEQDIVERVFALGDLKVNTIMTLRNDIVWLDKAFTTLIFLPMVYILYRKFRPTKPWTPRSLRLYLVCKVLVILFLVRIFCAGFIFTPVNYRRFTDSGLFPLIKAIFYPDLP